MPASTARGASGTGVPISSIRGPRLSATMCSTLGGGAPRVATASSTNSLSVSKRRARLCSRSKPMVEVDLRSMPALPQAEPPRWPGQTSTSSGRVSSRSCSERKMPAAPSRFSIARSGRATSPTNRESPVSTAQGSPPRSPSRRRKEVCSGRWPGVCKRLDLGVAEAELPAVGERLVRVLGVRQLVDVDRRARRAREPAVAGDVVRVVVGLEHVLDPDAVQAAEPQVGLDVPLRVDHGGDARAGVADQVGGAAQVLVQDLPEQHPLSLGSARSR